jgi:hypothetical protein
MKSVYVIPFLCLALLACKKQNPVIIDHTLNTHPYFFEILDKSGNNIIHSVNDTLMVTYTLNGVTQSNRLDIFKVQASATDATPIATYNGFVVSDANTSVNGTIGFMTAASGGLIHYHPESLGVRNFNVYLNGTNIGAIYLDYWAGIFSLNGKEHTIGNIPPAYFVAGYPAVLQYNILSAYYSISQPSHLGYPVLVLQLNGSVDK